MRRPELWWALASVLLCLAVLRHAAGQGAVPNAANEMLAHSSTIVLKVPNYEDARRRALEMAMAQGAELMDAKTEVDAKGRKHGWLQLRLSAAQLPALLPTLQDVGTLYSENVETTDNLSDYEALARRVSRLQQHEVRLNGVLTSDRRMRGSDILFLQERLFRASVDESLLSQQRLDLERSALTSTVQVELFEPGTLPISTPPRPISLPQHFLLAGRLAHDTLNHQLARGATASAYALAYAPFWAPALLIVLLLLRWAWKRRCEIFASLSRLIAWALGSLAAAVRWIRGAWDTRHQPLDFSRPTE